MILVIISIHKFSAYLPKLCLFIFFIAISLFSTNAGNRERLGIHLGYGSQRFGRLYHTNSYSYEVLFFHLSYDWRIASGRHSGLFAVFEPQFNRTRLKDNTHTVPTPALEFGLSCGFQYNISLLADHSRIYLGLQSGPHFISDSHPRQAEGFIFASSLYVGNSLRISDVLFFDLRFGTRHMSNAGIEEPNRGINTFFILAGCVFEPRR